MTKKMILQWIFGYCGFGCFWTNPFVRHPDLGALQNVVPVSGTIFWFCNRLARSAVRFVLNIWSIPVVIFFGALFCVVFARFDNLMSENRFELDAYFGRPFAFRYNQKPKISGVCLIYNCYPFSLKSHEQILQ